jgi:hypothetical protein
MDALRFGWRVLRDQAWVEGTALRWSDQSPGEGQQGTAFLRCLTVDPASRPAKQPADQGIAILPSQISPVEKGFCVGFVGQDHWHAGSSWHQRSLELATHGRGERE